MSSVIDSIERRQQRQGLPPFAPGDRVRVHFKVVEGSRERTQVFEGIVLKRQGSGARETFTVRKQSFGVGVERTFPLHSPKIEKLEIAARGDVRRAKLYYLRGRIGKAARVAERRWGIDDELISTPIPAEPEVEESQAAGPVVEKDSEPQAAGPVGAGDPPPPAVAEASSGEVPPTSPPAAETPEDGAEEPAAEAGETVAEVSPESEAEEPEAEETAAEESVAEEATAPAAEEAETPEAEASEAESDGPEEDEGSEAHEGESVADRPDSPDDLDEAAGDAEQAGDSEQD
jgi:large subunit ribosomal protein L19